MGLCVMALACAAIPAKADVRSYCEAYARNQADTRLAGSAILGAKLKPSPEAWKARNARALADCQALYTPKPVAEPESVPAKLAAETAKSETEPTNSETEPMKKIASAVDPASLVPGSVAWEDYCAAKYASFNRETGNYMSRTGKERPCRVTKS